MPFERMEQPTDAALLAAYAAGDPAAARALTERLTPRAFRYAARVLGDPAEAEDVVQEAMLRLWKQAPEWRAGEAKVSTWLYRVVTNLCTDRLRRRRERVPLDAIPDPADEAPGVLAGIMAADRARHLEAALCRLPERQRQAVVLRHLEGLANPEIAEIMDIRLEAVESLTARGRRGLSAALEGRKEELGYDDAE